MGFKFWWVFMVSSLHVWIPAANPESKEPEVIIWQKLRMWPLRWVFSFLWQQRLSSSSQSSGQKTLDNFLRKKYQFVLRTNFCVPPLMLKALIAIVDPSVALIDVTSQITQNRDPRVHTISELKFSPLSFWKNLLF